MTFALRTALLLLFALQAPAPAPKLTGFAVQGTTVNIENFKPQTPDPENPDPENPDAENPDPENPDPENANFFLAPEETATVTLRVFDLDPNDNAPAPHHRDEVVATTAAEAANTGETKVSTAVQGPDLTLDETEPMAVAPHTRPGPAVKV